ncbi:hypothetical protein KR222_001851 [Zaprionus bogoriensis]|nr:hypothetical protein KR222_001851 [Zaprionus bogoriensis]
MKVCNLLLVCTLFGAVIASDTPKVKIGIKKRAENCTRKAKSGDLIHVHYKVSAACGSQFLSLGINLDLSRCQGSLQDGTEFDSSHNRGKPFSFTLGARQVIKGWDQGLLGMCEGERRTLTIPPELGYGASGAGGGKIPANSVLIFDVEMVTIEPRGNEEL